MDPGTAKISKALLDVARVAEVELHQTEKGKRALAEKRLDGDDFNLLERIDGVRSVEHLLAISDDVVNVHSVLGKLLAAGFASTAPGALAVDAAADVAPGSSTVAPPSVNTAAPGPTLSSPAAPATSSLPVPPDRTTVVSSPSNASPPVAPTITSSPVAVAKTVAAVTIDPKSLVPAAPTEPKAASSPPREPAPVDEVSIAKRLLSIEAKHLFGTSAARLNPKIEACATIEEIYDIIVKFQEHLAKTGKVDPDVFLDRLTKGLAEAKKRAVAGTTP